MPITAVRAIWDMRITPVTFDFLGFLVLADCMRQLERKDFVDLTIRVDGFRSHSPRDRQLSVQEKQSRIYGIVLNCCTLLPTLRDVVVTYQERGPFDYPVDYKKNGIKYNTNKIERLVQQGANAKVLRAPDFIKSLINIPAPYVTLTPRMSRHFQERNIDTDDWYRFYQYLRDAGHNVVLIPDQDDVLGAKLYAKYNWDAFIPACMDMRIRLALYEGATMNITSATGPAFVLALSTAPMLTFDMLKSEMFNEEFYKKVSGFGVGGQYGWLQPNQRLVWKNSTFENLVHEWENNEAVRSISQMRRPKEHILPASK